jgi:hypothetical protein
MVTTRVAGICFDICFYPASSILKKLTLAVRFIHWFGIAVLDQQTFYITFSILLSQRKQNCAKWPSISFS